VTFTSRERTAAFIEWRDVKKVLRVPGRGDLAGQVRLGDPVDSKGSRRVTQAAPSNEEPVVVDGNHAYRFNLTGGPVRFAGEVLDFDDRMLADGALHGDGDRAGIVVAVTVIAAHSVGHVAGGFALSGGATR